MATLLPGLYASLFVTFVPATIVLGLRFYARKLKNIPLWWDDYLAILAWVAAVAYDASVFFLIYYGLGRHLEDLDITLAEAKYWHAMVQEIEEHAYTIGIGAAQLSLLALYWRVFAAMDGARMTIIVLSFLASAWIIVRLSVAVFQCYPPAFFWDKTIDGKCTVNPATFFLWSVSTHLAIDAALIILPATQIRRLRLPFVQKAAISAMFMFGIVVCIASIMMLVVSSHYDSYADDVLWNCVGVVQWSAVEVHLSVMTCCLPILRPVVRAFGGWWGRNFSSKSPNTSPSTSKAPSSYNSAQQGRKPRRETDSTHELTELDVETQPYIYGQGGGADTMVTSTKRQSHEDVTKSHDEGITVKHEVRLEFTPSSQV